MVARTLCRGLCSGLAYALTLSAVFACSGGSPPDPSASQPPGSARIEVSVAQFTQGEAGHFRCIAEDPDGDALLYVFDWGRARAEVGMTPRVPSGTAGDVTPTFQAVGEFTARCRAVDTHGQLGAWSEQVPFRVQRPPPPDDGKREFKVELFGQGRVTSTPGGIDCPTTCSARFDVGTHVSLSVEPQPGWRFAGMLRCGTEAAPGVFQVEHNRHCGAGFARLEAHAAEWRQTGAYHPTDATWGPEGWLLAVLDRRNEGGRLRIWNAGLGHVARVLRMDAVDMRSVSWGPRYEDLAVGLEDGRLGLIDPATEAFRQTWSAHEGPVVGVTWSAQGDELASVSNLGEGGAEVRFWSASTGAERRTPLRTARTVRRIHWSPDGARIALEVQGEQVEIHTLDPWVQVQEVVNADSFAWSPEGERYAVGSYRNVRVYDTVTHALQASWFGSWSTSSRMDWSPTKNWLVLVDALHSLTVLNVTTGVVVAEGSEVPRNPLSALGYSAVRFHPRQESFVAVESEPASVSIFSVDAPQARLSRNELLAHTSEVAATAWSPAGDRLASAGHDGKVRLWGTTGRAIATLDGHDGNHVRSLAWNASGTRLASGGTDGRICLWDVEQGRLAQPPLQMMMGPRERPLEVDHVALSPDGRTLASVGATVFLTGKGTSIQVWDVASGVELLRIPETDGPVVGLGWTQDGASLIIVYSHAAWDIWNLPSGALRRVESAWELLSTAVLSPDGTRLACSDRRGVSVLDVETGAVIAETPTWTTQLALAWHPAGTSFAGGGTERLVFQWQVLETGHLSHSVLGAHDSLVLGASWRGDGAVFTTSGADMSLVTWHAR
ncbi:WD40 repeat domain-containing protein [Myxococcus sp. AM010]|uniref:WD40 repeat domain-containing protein n=1 Tax=Myxococcus sp. AM010 TaxID=2745138 RepID=UPI001596378D|nr:WD40 repeat domain-containing protein [Myxococcus sp. AM010]NVJ19043.1 WD40 repeat domain-containing protein [Myxococcus sp. AM010]